MPEDVRRRYGLLGLLPALRGLHAPGGKPECDAARRRLAFQELYALQLKLLVQRDVARWVAPACVSVRVALGPAWKGAWTTSVLPLLQLRIAAPLRVTCAPGLLVCLLRACRAGLGGRGAAISAEGNQLLDLARASLPFELTGGQQAALASILGQMKGWPPMQCLLQVRARVAGMLDALSGGRRCRQQH